MKGSSSDFTCVELMDFVMLCLSHALKAVIISLLILSV